MKFVKEVIIAFLIICIIIIATGVLLQDKMPTYKKIPDEIQYEKNQEARQAFEIINNREAQVIEEKIKVYRNDKKELSAYKNTSKFEQQKPNPFARNSGKETGSGAGAGAGAGAGSSSREGSAKPSGSGSSGGSMWTPQGK